VVVEPATVALVVVELVPVVPVVPVVVASSLEVSSSHEPDENAMLQSASLKTHWEQRKSPVVPVVQLVQFAMVHVMIEERIAVAGSHLLVVEEIMKLLAHTRQLDGEPSHCKQLGSAQAWVVVVALVVVVVVVVVVVSPQTLVVGDKVKLFAHAMQLVGEFGHDTQ